MIRMTECGAIASHTLEAQGLVAIYMITIRWRKEGGICVYQSWLTTKRVSREEGDHTEETTAKVA